MRNMPVVACAVLLALGLAAGDLVGSETLVLQPGPEEGKDTYICCCEPDQNNPNGPITHLYQGQYGTCYDRTLIEWSLSALPGNAIINGAVMELWFNQLWGSESGEMVHFPILEHWEETEVTFGTQPAYSHDDSVVTGWPEQNNSWHAVDITEFVRMWHDGTLDNHGIYCHSQNTVSTCCAEFNSSDVATAERRPRLTIEYTDQTASDPEERLGQLRLDLSQNCPNPFSDRTRVRYCLERCCPVSLSVLDATGRKVADLQRTMACRGEHEVLWDAADLSSGLYMIRLRAGNRHISVRAVLLSD